MLLMPSILSEEIGSEAWAIIPSKCESSSLANQRKWLLSVALQVSMIAVIFSAIRISQSHFVGIDQHFLDQVRSKQQTIRPQQHLISLLITALRGHGVNREQRTGRTYDHQVPLIVCLINSLQHRFVKLFERIFLNFYLEFSCFKITS